MGLATPFATRIPDTTRRYHEFDALRSFAMLLGIVLHGLLSFMYVPNWPAQDIHQSQHAYSLMLHAIHGFRMPVFFLISGFFTAMMWRKRGAGGLVVHRAKRILLPLLIGALIIWPMMRALDHWGARVEAERVQKQWARADIWTAAKGGDLDSLRRRIAEGADVEGRDRLGVSLLEWAAMYDHPEAIDLLVENGAGFDTRNSHGSTALHGAACFGRTDAVKALIALGADPGAINDRGDTPLSAAMIDMGTVEYIAGILRMQIDGAAVAAGRRATAAYLQEFVAPGPMSPGGYVETAANDEAVAVAAGGAAMVGQAPREGGSGLLESAVGAYLEAAFFPVFHHLWFLNYLLWLVALFLAAVRISRRIPVRAPRWMIATPWCLLWLVPLTLLPQLFMTQTFGVDSASGLLPWLPTLAYYAVFFGFGALCFGRPEFEKGAGRGWGILFAAALPLLLIGIHFLRQRDGHDAAHVIMSVCAVLYAWLMVFGMIGFFQRFVARENKRIRYLSDASYWLYLAHLPLIMALQIRVSDWDIHHVPKFLLVCTLTFVILIVMYEHLVRYTLIGTALNGKKIRPGSISGQK